MKKGKENKRKKILTTTTLNFKNWTINLIKLLISNLSTKTHKHYCTHIHIHSHIPKCTYKMTIS